MAQEEATQEILVDLIDEGTNVRRASDKDADVGLMGSISEVGVIAPILVMILATGRFLLIVGHRRLRATRTAGRKSILARVIPRQLTEQEILELQLSENLQRLDLNSVEAARGMDGYMRVSNLSATEVAKRLGQSSAGISNLRSLLRLPDEILKRVELREIPLSAAYELARMEDANKQAQLLVEVLNGGLTCDGLVGRIRSERRNHNGNSHRSASSRVTALLGAGRSITLTGPDLSLESVISWLEELLARARKVRPQGLELKTFIKMLKDQAKPEPSSLGLSRTESSSNGA